MATTIPQSKAKGLMQKFLTLMQQDIDARQGVGRITLGRYTDLAELNRLILPEGKEAQQIFIESITTFKKKAK